MSISSEISRIQTNVANAYTALSAKGATMPSVQNTANLASAIESIEMMTAEAMSIETIRAICYVPSDFEKNYTELEYIQSSGTQYIDTGFKPNQNTRMVMDAQLTSGAASQVLFGTRTSSLSANFNVLTDSTTAFRSDYGDSKLTTSAVALTSRITIDKNKNVCKINTATITNAISSFQCGFNLFLFCVSTAGNPAAYAKMKLYSCQIYDNGALVRDYVPCKNSGGVFGLYDMVNKQFYANAGSGSFSGA